MPRDTLTDLEIQALATGIRKLVSEWAPAGARYQTGSYGGPPGGGFRAEMNFVLPSGRVAQVVVGEHPRNYFARHRGETS